MASKVSKVTWDHDAIRRWAEERGGMPAAVKGTTRAKGDAGIIRIDFPGYSGGDTLRPITWNEFFDKFDASDLAMVYEERTASGQRSNFNKLVSRESVESGGGTRRSGGLLGMLAAAGLMGARRRRSTTRARARKSTTGRARKGTTRKTTRATRKSPRRSSRAAAGRRRAGSASSARTSRTRSTTRRGGSSRRSPARRSRTTTRRRTRR